MLPHPFIYTGTIIHSKNITSLEIIDNGIIVVVEGKIVSLEHTTSKLKEFQDKYNVEASNIVQLSYGQFIMPGFIDTHIHAPQYPNAGLGYDMPLLDWLENYTFPLEKKYGNEEFAKRVYNAVVKRTLSVGTTTACYYATIHLNSCTILADIAASHGQRVFIGKVNMNKNTPAGYGETTELSLKDTETFIKNIQDRGNPLVTPVVTPRFALSCDMEIMEKLAQLAKKYNVPIQTHISENTSEVEVVLETYPDCESYVDVYDKAGLLTKNTILAHGVFLSNEELQVLAARGTSLSHCPNSNISLHSGLLNIRNVLAKGVTIGLGTDCAGGYGTSILDAIRHALAVSIHVSFREKSEILKIGEVFFLATLGGAQVLSIDNLTGNFEIGKDFDALFIDLLDSPNLDILEDYNSEQLLQKFIYLGDDRNIKRVYVAGQLVKDDTETITS